MDEGFARAMTVRLAAAPRGQVRDEFTEAPDGLALRPSVEPLSVNSPAEIGSLCRM